MFRAARSRARPRGARFELQQQRAVLERAVVVDADRHEHEVALAVRVEPAQHVVEDAEARLAEASVAREPALGVERLRHPVLGRHRDVALEHPAVELVAGTAAHEVRAHRPDELLQRPDAGPLADGVRERGAVRGEIGGQHVVHVGAVIHHEDDGRVRRDPGKARVVDVADPDAEERLRDALRHPVAEPEVEIRVERRHDLGRVLARLRGGDLARHALRLGVGRCRLLHLRVVDEDVDERAAAGALERPHLDLEPVRDLVEDAVRAAAQEPAPARAHHPVVDAERGEHGDRDREPGGQGDRHDRARLTPGARRGKWGGRTRFRA